MTGQTVLHRSLQDQKRSADADEHAVPVSGSRTCLREAGQRPICATSLWGCAMRTLLPVFLLMGGCVEYAVNAPPSIHGVSNAVTPETPVHTDRLIQVTVPEVDVLWVLDNSSSMDEEAVKIIDNFPRFLDYFLGSGLDYHIGMISTNMELAGHQGELQEGLGNKWIDVDTASPEDVFAEMTPFYPGVSHNESGRDAIHAALALQTIPNDGFLRESASLHIVLISDEDDHSVSITKDEFIGYLDTLKPQPDRLSFNSIVGVQTPCDGSWERGRDYIDVSEAIGGIVWSICEDDWAPVVDSLGLQAAGLKREFFLAHQPALGTIEVDVVFEGVTYDFVEGDDWYYTASRNSITFHEYIPDALAEVSITYDQLSALEFE